MKALYIAGALVLATIGARAADKPEWAYPPRPAPSTADNSKLLSLPGSEKRYTQAQIGDATNVPDWFPGEHPPLPNIVAHGKPGGVPGCGLCHLVSGDGHPESASVTGQSIGYIVRQMQAFRNEERVNPRSKPMIDMAKALSDDEVRDIARYFSALKPVPGHVTVKEAAMVPKTFVGAGSMRFLSPGNEMEPIGKRIIDVPEDPERAEMRDPHTGFIDYVPPGSLKRGEDLAKGAGGKVTPCAVCHGKDYRGLGDVPPLAGQHGIYLYRQLRDMKDGDRKGGNVPLMSAVVEALDDDDLIALCAYLASLNPK